MQERQAYDLTSLNEAIAKDRRYVEVSRRIEEFGSACSIVADLMEAWRSLETLSELEHDADARKAFGKALMTVAIIAYSRATISETNNRRRIGFEKYFSPEQLVEHIALKDLRSTVFAHYHRGKGRYGEFWRKDRVVIKEYEGELIDPSVAWVNPNFKADAARSLINLTGFCLDKAQELREVRRTQLFGNLKNLTVSDEYFKKMLRRHLFDYAKFYPEGHSLQKKFLTNFDAIAEETYTIIPQGKPPPNAA